MLTFLSHAEMVSSWTPVLLASSFIVSPTFSLALASTAPGQSPSGRCGSIFCTSFIVGGLVLHGCPCGYQGDQEKECTCSPAQLQRYRSRLSGPLLDRIDICITVPRVRFEELAGEPAGESSAAVRQRVEGARAVQRERFRGTPVTCNAAMTGAQVRRFCGLTREAQRMLQAAFRQMALSARAYDRVLKVARTIADLEGAAAIGTAHIAEALQYREREGAAF